MTQRSHLSSLFITGIVLQPISPVSPLLSPHTPLPQKGEASNHRIAQSHGRYRSGHKHGGWVAVPLKEANTLSSTSFFLKLCDPRTLAGAVWPGEKADGTFLGFNLSVSLIRECLVPKTRP